MEHASVRLLSPCAGLRWPTPRPVLCVLPGRIHWRGRHRTQHCGPHCGAAGKHRLCSAAADQQPGIPMARLQCWPNGVPLAPLCCACLPSCYPAQPAAAPHPILPLFLPPQAALDMLGGRLACIRLNGFVFFGCANSIGQRLQEVRLAWPGQQAPLRPPRCACACVWVLGVLPGGSPFVSFSQPCLATSARTCIAPKLAPMPDRLRLCTHACHAGGGAAGGQAGAGGCGTGAG